MTVRVDSRFDNFNFYRVFWPSKNGDSGWNGIVALPNGWCPSGKWDFKTTIDLV